MLDANGCVLESEKSRSMASCASVIPGATTSGRSASDMGQVFFVYGGAVNALRGWEAGELFLAEEGWEPDALLAELLARFPDGAEPTGMLEGMRRAGGRSIRDT